MLCDVPPFLARTGLDTRDVCYVTDAQLKIVFVNEGWRRFASDNHGHAVRDGGHDSVLDNFSGSEKARWTVIYTALLEGNIPRYEDTLLCPSPQERRTHTLRIERVVDPETGRTYLVHRSVLVEAWKAEQERGTRTHLRHHCALHAGALDLTGGVEPLHGDGGDLIWFRERKAGGIELVIADVMGHGRPAALVVELLRDALAEQVHEDLALPEVTSRLNHTLCERMPKGLADEPPRPLFVTGLLMRVPAHGQGLQVCNFGHGGLLFSETGLAPLPPGLPLGITQGDGLAWPELTLAFAEHGTRFLAFTDGITEQFDERGEMFGPERLSKVFQARAAQSLDELLAGIQRDLSAFRGRALVKDDCALLAAEVCPSSSSS